MFMKEATKEYVLSLSVEGLTLEMSAHMSRILGEDVSS